MNPEELSYFDMIALQLTPEHNVSHQVIAFMQAQQAGVPISPTDLLTMLLAAIIQLEEKIEELRN